MSYTPEVKNKISTLNSVVLTNVSGGTIWTGVGEDVSKYGRAGVSIWTPFGESCDGVLTFETSRDGVNWGGPNRTFADTSISQPHMWNIVEQYLRLKYTHGTTSATTVVLQTQYSVNSDTLLGHQLDETLLNETEAIITRSIIGGQDNVGNYRNVRVSHDGDLRTKIDNPLTSFGELRTAEITPILQIINPYEINYDLVSSGSTNIGYLSYDSDNSFIVINSGSGTTSNSYVRSNSLVKYRNGQGLLIRFTTVFDDPKSGNTQIAGWGDEESGFFFGYSGTTFGTIRRNNHIDYFTPQSDWSVDKFDGSGGVNNPSGELLNPQKGNVYEMQIQWLGFGAIRFNIESNSSSGFESADIIEYTNENTIPSISNPSHPLWFCSNNTTNNTNVVLKVPSMAAFVEGQVTYTGKNYSYSRDVNPGAGPTNIFTLYIPSIYRGKKCRTRSLLKSISITTDGTNPVKVELIKNGTLTTPTYSQLYTYSPVSGDTTGTYTTSTGRILYSLKLNKSSNISMSLIDQGFFINDDETLSVVGSGSNAGFGVSLSWVDDI